MKEIRQATELLGVIERGDAAHDLTLEIEKVLKALQDAGGPKQKVSGSVTLKLQFHLEGSYLRIEADIGSKTPKVKRNSTSYFLTQDARISTEHPDQQNLFDGPREVRSAQ